MKNKENEKQIRPSWIVAQPGITANAQPADTYW